MRVTTVLVVDESEPLATAVAALLVLEGFDTAVASTAAQAVASITHQRIDVLLTGLLPSDSPGSNLAALARRWALPVVVMTGRSGRDVRAIVGTTAWLPKPFTTDALLNAVQAARRTGARAGNPPRRARLRPA
jgi:DNA-binding response OmpR family regulator